MARGTGGGKKHRNDVLCKPGIPKNIKSIGHVQRASRTRQAAQSTQVTTRPNLEAPAERCRMLGSETIQRATHSAEPGSRETDQPLRDLSCANILKSTMSP